MTLTASDINNYLYLCSDANFWIKFKRYRTQQNVANKTNFNFSIAKEKSKPKLWQNTAFKFTFYRSRDKWNNFIYGYAKLWIMKYYYFWIIDNFNPMRRLNKKIFLGGLLGYGAYIAINNRQ